MTDAVLLLGGMANNSRLWEAVVPRLVTAATVHVPDYQACDTIESMADVAFSTSDARMLSLVGFSMGGYVAQAMVRRHPERIARLALIGTQAGSADEATKVAMAKTAAAAHKNFDGVLARMLPGTMHHAHVADAAMTSVVLAMFREVGQAAFIRQCHAVAHRADDRAVLANYRKPTLIACGRQDQVCPPSRTEDLLLWLPEATVRWFDDCGHLAPLERPAEVANALNAWFAGNAAGGV